MLRIGTCSWKYDSWKGIVYPDKEELNYLAEYSKHFNTVEVDQWFWSLFEPKKAVLPSKDDVEFYTNSVPDDFKFTIKIPNSLTLTHFYNRDKSSMLTPNPYFLDKDLFDSFIHSLEPMRNKIGVLMFQLEYLNQQKVRSLNEFLDKFEKFISSIDKKHILGVEIRNPNYLKKSYFDFLERNDLSVVLLQGYYMPPIWDVLYQYKEQIKGTVIIRLHGPDRLGIENKSKKIWNKIIESKEYELSKVAEIINYLETKKVDTYVNVNNHYEGSAPLTIQKINKLIK